MNHIEMGPTFRDPIESHLFLVGGAVQWWRVSGKQGGPLDKRPTRTAWWQSAFCSQHASLTH